LTNADASTESILNAYGLNDVCMADFQKPLFDDGCV